MSTKVILRRAEVFVLAEVCLPRRPRALSPRSHVPSEKRKWRHTWKADESSCLFKMHADISEVRLPLEERLPLV